MHLRRFTAENISKALEMVKAELGSNAIILSTEKKKKRAPDASGFVSYTEVVAAVDREEGLAAGGGKPLQEPGDEPQVEKQPSTSLEELSKEVKAMKGTLSAMSKLLEDVVARMDKGLCQNRHVDQQGSTSEIGPVLSSLGLDHETASAILQRAHSSFSHQPVTANQIVAWLKNYMLDLFKPGIIAEDSLEPVWWAFIGPTGVGKTTTLAKIAARLKFLKRRQGLLVSVDSYRLGAIDQLQKYATLMDIPLETAKTNKDLLRIFSCHKDKDFILVDTTGRNPFSSSHRIELERIFDAIPGLMAQVMLCSTYKREDLMESINFYKTFPIAGWTFTKTDETRSLAASVLPVLQAGVSLSYLTNGQRVPEDIEIAAGPRLCEELFVPSSDNLETGLHGMSHLNATVC